MKVAIPFAGAVLALLGGTAMTPALAQNANDQSGTFFGDGAWYVGAGGGWNWTYRPHVMVPGSGRESTPTIPGIGSATGSPDSGNDSYVGVVSVGRSFGSSFMPGVFGDLMDGFRAELEAGYRDNSVRWMDGVGAAVGHQQVFSGMVNGLYDLNISRLVGDNFPLKPYVGAGIGVADYQARNIRPAYELGPTSSASATVFAYQGIAGVGVPVTPQMTVGVEYRFFGTTGGRPTGISNDYRANSALLSIRYAFGEERQPQPEPAAYVPPPAPPPVQQAPRSYLVFFDFNKSDLTKEARQVVDQAATNAHTAAVTRIDCTGYTDTVGSDAYDMRLSRRRALSVSAELQAQGAPEHDIAIYAKGKHDLLVPTGDGVREPQNRRVQIVFSDGSGPNS